MPETVSESNPVPVVGAARALRDRVQAELSRTPFRPPLWLRHPHAQTVGGRYLRRMELPELKLERWDTPDDDFLRVHALPGRTDAPVALLSHGLEGSVESKYMVGVIRELEAIGWTAVAFEHRSCGGEMNRACRMYHSGETTDLAFVVDRLIETYPGRPIYIAAFSLGANQLAKWLGESGHEAPEAVRAAAVVSAPFDLLESQAYLDTGIRLIYVREFLKSLIPKAIEKDAAFPGILDIDRIKQSKTFYDFDNWATAPLHGFQDARDYYTSVACGQFLHGIRRPTMVLSAEDDPFNPGHTIPHDVLDANPHLIPQITQHGGHVGFIRRDAGLGMGYWAEEQIVRFFQAVERESA